MCDPRQVPPLYEESRADGATEPPFDPLRLCVVATVALIAWIFGPIALVVFAAIGFVGYFRARRAGLLRSRCKLGDTRLVLAYLAVLVLVGVVGAIYALNGGRIGV